MKVTLYTVSAFIENDEGGNLAGVVLNADNLTHLQKLKIALKAGYSETAFVCSDREVDFSVSFYTPTGEVDFCGHATIALFYLLYKQGFISEGHYKQSTKVGILSATLSSNSEVTMQQALPKTLGRFSAKEVAPLINLKPEALFKEMPYLLPNEILSTGLADLIIPVPLGLLDNITPNLGLINDFCLANKLIGLHLFELNEHNLEITASCRNFAPLVGIDEESATGSACGALACYLYKYLKIQSFTFQQGRSMGQKSRITASINAVGEEINRIEVGGKAKLIKKEVIDL